MWAYFYSKISGNKRCSKIISYGIIEYDDKYLYISKAIMKKILLKDVDKIIKHIKILVKEYPNIDLFVLKEELLNAFYKKKKLKETLIIHIKN